MSGPADPLAAPGVAVEPEALLALRRAAMRARRRARAAGLAGGTPSRRRGRGLEPLDIRPFETGDDPRHIDRNVSARLARPHVRRFHEERERAALLVADFRPAMLWGTRRAFRSVAAAEALALAGWRAVMAGGRVSLLALGAFAPVYLQPRTGARAMGAVAGSLAAAHRAALAGADAATAPLELLLAPAAGLAPRRGRVWLATGLDAPGEGLARLLAALDRRARLGVLLLTDAFETAAPAGDYPVVTPAGRRAILTVGRHPDRAGARLDWLRRHGIAAAAVPVAAGAGALLDALDALEAGDG